MVEEDVVLDAFEVWRSQPPLDYADCYHPALTKALGMPGIYTFDRKMDRFPGVKRVEP
jgi:predicted nucleic acid-binding protein